MRARFRSAVPITGALIVLAGSLALTLFTLLSRGLSLDMGGIALTSRNPVRPFVLAGIAAAALVAWSLRAAHWYRHIEVAAASERARTMVAVTLALSVAVVGMANGSFVAAAADSYGYVVEAKLLAQGALSFPQEWASTFPWPNAEGSWSPLGFRPSPDGASIVPTYPPGFPLLMVGLSLLGGTNAGFLVVPLAAAGAVLGTFWLGRRLNGSATGLVAAILLACSPTLLFHACIPMSDLPATALWTLAIALSLGRGFGSAFGSGVSAGLAVLVRPNLVPLLLAPLIAIITSVEEPRARRLHQVLGFVAGVLPAAIVLALLNSAWYGSPVSSGYPVREMFRLDHIWTNVWSYPSWLIETQTAFVLLALPGLLVVRRHRLLLAGIPAIVALCYAFYLPFDHWTYLRFFLPALPALFILASASAVRIIDVIGSAPVRVVALTLVGAVALSSWQEARIRGAFVNHKSVERFVTIPRFVRAQLPENAVFLTRLYSGSIREYGQRLTLRWDVLDPAWLDPAIEELQRRGRPVFIVIESAEEETLFRDRFSASNKWGALDWPAAAEYVDIETVWIYDVRDIGRQPGTAETQSIPVTP